MPGADTLLYVLVLALAVSLPFEPVHPLVSLGWLELNHLKLLLLTTAVVWIIGLSTKRVDRRVPRATWSAALFVGLALFSALLAPSYRGEALKFVGRLASGTYACVLVYEVVRNRRDRALGVLWALSLGAGASALLGLGEIAHWSALGPLLETFKVAPTLVGGDLRLSASFQYATIAAMFFELVVPLALALAAIAAVRWQRCLAVSIAIACSLAVVLTLTRAGFVALTGALALLLAVAWARPRWRKLALPTTLTATCTASLFVGLALLLTGFGTRLNTENDWGWYAVAYTAPQSLTLTPGAPTETVVTAQNTGQATWTTGGDHPFALAFRWLSAEDGSELELPFTQLELPHDVAPGQAVQLAVQIATRLPAGDYRLAWGMLQQRVLWFHDRGYPDVETVVHVMPGASAGPVEVIGTQPRSDTSIALAPVPRRELWSAAVQMIGQRPLVGIGPDNFRHVYGAYLGLSDWDQRVHANNLYLELLADLGVLGAAGFVLVVGPVIIGLVRGLSARSGVVVAGLTTSLLTFFVHGTLDYFLEFTPVYLLFWLVVGLSMAAPQLDSC